jgi:hypothetical protein
VEVIWKLVLAREHLEPVPSQLVLAMLHRRRGLEVLHVFKVELAE